MLEGKTQEEIEKLLADYIATVENPEYGGDRNIINPKFPEFEGLDPQILEDYIATYRNPKYRGDVKIINSKFPEFFEGVKKKDESQFTSPEEVMVSDTEVVEQPGSSGPSPQINPNQPEEVVDERVTEEIQDPETLTEINQIQEVPNRTGAADFDYTTYTPDSVSGEESTAVEDFFGKNVITDFLGDMYRAGAQGQAQGGSLDESLELFAKGKDVTDEDIQDFIIAQEEMNAVGQSDEMRDFNKIYQEDGGGWWGFIKGVANNPSVIPQLFVSSVSAMVNPTVIAAAGVGAGTGAAIGSTGFSAGPLGVFTTAGGAIAGAMGAAGGTLETGLTFAELLLEQLDGKPMTKENVREILESEEKMQGIRFKSAGRGFAIGMVDAISAGVASKVTAKVAGLTGKKLVAATAGGAIEAGGGSVGEVAGRLVAGQEMDVAEIGFEGIAGTATAPITVGYGLYKAPKYYINPQNGGEVAQVSGPEMAKFIREASSEDLAGATLEIENDPELKAIAEQRKKDIKQDAGIIKQLKEAGITDEAAITELTALEREKQALEGNTTRAGKLKLKEIDAKIDAIMDQEVTEEVKVTEDELATQDSDSVKRETYESVNEDGEKTIVEVTTAKDGSRTVKYKLADGSVYSTDTFNKDNTLTNEEIIESSTTDGGDFTKTETIEGWENLHSEKQIANRKLKIKQDAIQESSTESVDVQEQTIDSEELGEGDTQGDITTESQDSETDIETPTQEEIAPATDEEISEATTDLGDLINRIDDNNPGQNKSRTDVDEDVNSEPESLESLDNELGIVETELENTPRTEFKKRRDLKKKSDEIAAKIEALQTDETVVEAVTPDTDGNLNIIESIEGSQVNLPGQQVNNTLSVTERTTEQNDNHYSSDIFTKENPNTTVEQHESKILNLANKAVNAITKLLPDTKIVIHRSEDAYNKFVTGKGTRGTFDPNTNTIHINMPKANAKTIAHEVFHAVLYNKYGSDIKIAEVTKRMVDAVKRKVTDKKLKQKLDDFSDQYTEFQNEEYLSELVGLLADNYPSLSAPEKSLVKRWLQKVAKMLKIDALIDTDADVLDLLNTIGKSVKEGKEITATEVKQLDMFEGGQQVDNPSAAFKEQKVGGFEVTYTENEKITQYIKDGRITQPENLESFRGNKTAITSPDDMVVGEISFEGEKIFEGQGGLFFVTKFGDVWAAGDKTTATKLADMINKSVDANGGKGYLTLTKGTDKKLISSAAGVNSSLGIIDVLLNKNILPKAVIRTAVNKVIKDFGGGNINLTGSSKQMISQLRKFFGNKQNATFEARGTVMERIITEIGMDKRLGDLKKKDSKLTKILGGDPSKTLVGGKTSKTANSLVDLVASLAAEDITKGLNTGDIYGVIEVDGKVEYYPGDHPSYPAHIRQVNGNPPVLHLPKDRPPAKNYLMRDSNKIYKTPAVSPTEYGSFYEKADSKVTDTDVITQEDVKILYPKQRQQKVVFNVEKQRVYKNDSSGVTFLTQGYGGRFINIPKKAINIKDIDGVSQYQKPLVEVTMERDVYNNQDQARSVVDGKEKFVNQLETIRGFKKIRLIKDTPTAKTDIQRVNSLAKQSGIKENNFLPGTLSNPQALNRKLKELGYSLKTYGNPSKPYGYGILKPNGRLFTISKQRQQIVFNKAETPASIIKKARELGFNNPEIKDVLMANTDLKVSDINTMLKVPVNAFKNLPDSFVNVKGGIKQGLSTFKKINEFIAKLNKKNQTLENPLTQEQLATKAIEKLQTTEAYKNAADFTKVKGETVAKKTPSTQQLAMEVAVRESFDVKPTKDAAKTLRNLKSKITERLKGMRDIQKVKKELRNFIRESLPNDQYTKANVLKMVRFITNLTTKELTGTQLKTTMLKIQNFVTERNIENLKTKKDLLLDVSKYEKKENNLLKGKIVSADVKNRIKKIAESQPGPSMTAKEIEAQMATWNEEANKIIKDAQGGLLTDGELSRLSDLQIMINLSNSKLMDGSDIPSIHQVSVLDAANSALESLILEGRSDLRDQLAAQRKEYVKEMQDLYNDMTGNNVDLSPKKITVKEATTALKKDGITDPTDIQIADKIAELQDQNIEDIQKQMDQIQKDYDINASRLKQKTKATKNPLVLLKRGFESITTGITNFLNRAESLQGLMDIISLSPGKMLGGVAQKLVYKKINSSSIEYKGRMIMLQNKISDKMSEIYGKKWKKVARKNSDPIGTGVYRDVDAVAEAQKVYDENPTKQNQKKLDKVLLDQEIIMSPNQIYYQYNQFIDPANKKSYLSEFNFDFKNDPDRIMKELYDTLSQENKDWAQWQREEFFPELYDHYNEVYKKIYRTDMPWNEFYAGRIYRTDAEGMGMGDVEVLNLQGNGSQFNTSVGAASTKARVDNTNPIAQMDGNDALMTYVTDMEWFAAYGENVRNISKLLGNKNIKKTIEVNHGKDMNYLIETVIDKIASRGINTAKGNTMVNTFNNIFITSRLGLNPTVMLKQLTSMPTYANSIGPVNYAKYSFKNKAEMLKVYKEIRDNSVYMKDRSFGDMKKVIESYSANQKVAFIPKGMSAAFDYFSDFMMVTTKVGDKAAIYLGGMPNYSYYKAKFKKSKPNATEQQAIDYAIRKFEADTKATQQSMDLQDKDYYQSGDALHRAFNMFMTTPKQYYRMERMAFRQLWRKTKAFDRKAGKGTLWQNVRTVAMYHAVMPALFQYVALGLPGMMRDRTDEDDQDMLRSIVLGNLNALFIAGDVLTMGFDQLRGKPWAESAPSLPMLEMMAELNRLSNRMNKVKDPEKKAEYANKFTTKFLELTSVPASNLNKLYKNYEKLIDGDVDDPGEAFLRAFNYSDYMIEGQVTPPTREDMEKLKKENLKLYKQVYPAWEKEFGNKKSKDKNSVYNLYKKNPKLWKQKNPGQPIPRKK
jgi:hypothetical protein